MSKVLIAENNSFRMFGGQSKSTAPRLLKFEPPKDPIELENAKREWEIPHSDKLAYIEKKFREKYLAIDNDGTMRQEDKQAIKNAMQVYLQQMQLEAWDSEANECYIKEFRDFLQGKSKYNTPQYKHLVPWTNHALVGKDIDAYIDAVIDKKLEFDMKIAKMFNTKMAPRTLQDAWLYFIFIVKQKKPPTDLFLKAWDAFYPYDDRNNGGDNPQSDWKKHPEDAKPREDQKGIAGPKESCDEADTSIWVGIPGYDTKPTPGVPPKEALPQEINPATPSIPNTSSYETSEGSETSPEPEEERLELNRPPRHVERSPEAVRILDQDIPKLLEDADLVTQPQLREELQRLANEVKEAVNGSIGDLQRAVADLKRAFARKEGSNEEIRADLARLLQAVDKLGREKEKKEETEFQQALKRFENLLSERTKNLEKLSSIDKVSDFVDRETERAASKANKIDKVAQQEQIVKDMEAMMQRTADTLHQATLSNLKDLHASLLQQFTKNQLPEEFKNQQGLKALVHDTIRAALTGETNSKFHKKYMQTLPISTGGLAEDPDPELTELKLKHDRLKKQSEKEKLKAKVAKMEEEFTKKDRAVEKAMNEEEAERQKKEREAEEAAEKEAKKREREEQEEEEKKKKREEDVEMTEAEDIKEKKPKEIKVKEMKEAGLRARDADLEPYTLKNTTDFMDEEEKDKKEEKKRKKAEKKREEEEEKRKKKEEKERKKANKRALETTTDMYG
jgi:hypothetical protein